jgi:cobaltochelatase CobN
MGLAATTGEVEEWIYDDMHEKYIQDDDMVRRMKENNLYAYIEIIEQMMEYYKRGYWEATKEQLDRLKQVYLQVEGDIEDRIEDHG